MTDDTEKISFGQRWQKGCSVTNTLKMLLGIGHTCSLAATCSLAQGGADMFTRQLQSGISGLKMPEACMVEMVQWMFQDMAFTKADSIR